MRILTITLLAAVLMISACKSKKSTTSVATTSTATTTATNTSTTNSTSNSAVAVGPMLPPKSTDGLYEPGAEELTAAQTQFKDVNLEDLKKGFEIYNKGACTGCHGAKNIYKRPTERWKEIIDDMAARAAITDADKSAVYKYVISIKATQK